MRHGNRRCAIWLVAVMLIVPPAFARSGAQKVGKDGPAIQKLIDVLPPEGGTVRLEPGTYAVRESIVLRDNVTLQGAGMDKTIIRVPDGAAASAPSSPTTTPNPGPVRRALNARNVTSSKPG